MPEFFDIVIPTVGRACLARLLESLPQAGQDLAQLGRIVVVDDRAGSPGPLALPALPDELASRVTVVRSGGRGPAAARNAGWAATASPWVAFLDDDVLVTSSWPEDLSADLSDLPATVAGSHGCISVPLPGDRRPTDWERNVKGLETARWATADMAYRREVLEQLGGFDERFPRAYREDADLGLRVVAAGFQIAAGHRRILHPVRPAGRWVSLRLQAGNADDALMRALHGWGWRERAGVPRGRRRRHLVVTAAGVAGLLGLAMRRPGLAAAGCLGWLAGTAELAAARIGPGPRTPEEVSAMLLTSLAMPSVATWHWLSGTVRAHRLVRAGEAAP